MPESTITRPMHTSTPLPVAPKTFRLTLLFFALIVLGLVALGIWFWQGSLEESVTGVGQLVPAGKVQRVMASGNGIVTRVTVQENQAVHAGDILVELDPEATEAEKDSLSEQLALLQAESKALRAAVGEGTAVPTGTQSAWLQAMRSTYAAQTAEAGLEVQKSRHLYQEALEKQSKSKAILKTSEDLLAKYRQLYNEGGLPEKTLSEYEQRVIDQRGDLAALQEEIKARQYEMAQAGQRVNEVSALYKKDLMGRLSQHEQDIARLSGDVRRSNWLLQHVIMRAPIDGVVNELTVRGPGEVVSAGQVLMSVVPEDQNFIAEVKVTNKELSFIHVGQRTFLRLDALPYQQFGRLYGHVVSISPSTVVDNEGRPFYHIRIKPEQQVLKKHNKAYPLRAGMTLTADLVTREKNILSFFTEPLNYQFDRAFHDPTNR